MAAGYPYHSSKKMTRPSPTSTTTIAIHNPLSVNNPLVDTESPIVTKEEIPTEKEIDTDFQWTLTTTDNELIKEEYHANQNYIDQDGKEQHFSVLMAKLHHTNSLKNLKKRKGLQTKVSDFVSSCKKKLSTLQTKKTIQKRTTK